MSTSNSRILRTSIYSGEKQRWHGENEKQVVPGISNNSKRDSNNSKRINVSNQAVADELHATVKVLHIQQEENYRFRDHVNLLDGEIDQVKKLVEIKQQIINKKDKTIAELEDTIAQLQKLNKEIKIERSAFKVLEDQNADLLKRFQQNMRNIEELEKTNKMLKAGQSDVRSYADNKLNKAADVEVLMNVQIQDLALKLSAAEIAKTSAIADMTALKSECNDLKQSLKMVNELRVEQVNRSRMTEYRTLRQIDEMSSKYVHERDEKDKMRETVQLAVLRGDFLEERLSNALEAKEEEQLMVETLVSQVEYSNDAMRTREQMLERKSMTLEAQLKLSQKAVTDMIKRYKKLEGMYDEAKTIASKHYAGKGAPFVGMGRSIELSSQLQMQSEIQLQSVRPITVRQVHPDAPMPRAKTPKPPVPDPLEASKKFVSGLEEAVPVTAQNSTYSDFNSSRDDTHRSDDRSRDVLDDIDDDDEGLGSTREYREQQTIATNTMANSYSQAGQRLRQHPALPALVTTDGSHHAGKISMLRVYFDLIVSSQKSKLLIDSINLSNSSLTDDDFKLVVQYLRVVSLQRPLVKIDLSHNMISSASVEAIAAFVISIAPRDLAGRTNGSVLEINLQHNHLSKRSIEKIGLKIKATPRPEVHLTAFEHDAYSVVQYNQTAPLLRVDCRKNAGKPGKIKLKEFVALEPSATDTLPVRMYGEPGDEEGIMVYPRNNLFVKST